jgi:cysteinyl-tRNA synthetase
MITIFAKLASLKECTMPHGEFMVTFYNTLTAQKHILKPLLDAKVTMYVCGITPYDFSHMGHGRCYVSFDVLYRFLKALGYNPVYCRNYTDIDDKLLNKAEQEYGDRMRYPDVAKKYITAYQEDMARLNCVTPDYEPYATHTIPEMIEHIAALIEKDRAYAVDGDVYFRVKKFADYGALSKRTIDDLQAGARVDINEKKDDPLDFALWKGEPEGEFWKSPWGYGRPGWHIECSAMAKKHLGEHIDIHAGGMDLIFPHHENEIAQSESVYGKHFATIWLHNAFVRINQEKMSKSLGNFFTLRQLFEHVEPMVIRFYLLQHHYRSPLDFTLDDLKASEKAYRRLSKAFEATVLPDQIDTVMLEKSDIYKKLMAFLAEDLNTAGALGLIFEHLTDLGDQAVAVKYVVQKILGLTLEPVAHVAITAEIQALLTAREQARLEKKWTQADALREQLRQLGYEVQDKK